MLIMIQQILLMTVDKSILVLIILVGMLASLVIFMILHNINEKRRDLEESKALEVGPDTLYYETRLGGTIRIEIKEEGPVIYYLSFTDMVDKINEKNEPPIELKNSADYFNLGIIVGRVIPVWVDEVKKNYEMKKY